MSAAAVVLAAGASRRMGTPKQLLPVEGRPLLERVVAETCASRLDEVVVVLGANAARIQAEVHLGRARAVLNPAFDGGMSSSLKAGLGALGADVDRAVVILGDQPAISAGLLDRLCELQSSSGLPSAALSFDGLLHPPVVLARELWAELSSLTGDVGCRDLIRVRPELVATLDAPSPGRHPVDVDTPEDYRRLIAGG
jgi:molybdenum cofactor cytidylyltransferase